MEESATGAERARLGTRQCPGHACKRSRPRRCHGRCAAQRAGDERAASFRAWRNWRARLRRREAVSAASSTAAQGSDSCRSLLARCHAAWVPPPQLARAPQPCSCAGAAACTRTAIIACSPLVTGRKEGPAWHCQRQGGVVKPASRWTKQPCPRPGAKSEQFWRLGYQH